MQKGLSLLVLMILISYQNTFSQYHTDKKLENKLHALIDSFHGTAGIYVRNLKTGKEVAINADTIFPTASIVKLPILIGIFNKIEEGEFTYHQPMLYRDSMAHGGSGLMQYFKDSSKTDLSNVITLMITHSDNTAAIWCEKLAGGGLTINEWLTEHGFQSTRLNSRTPGRKNNYDEYGWGQTTPREMADLLVMIRQGKAVTPAASERMYRILTHVYWDDYALSKIPPYVQVASKQGMVDASRSEAVLVNAPHGDYVFYIATKNNVDIKWEPGNEAWQLARKVSALIWNYFEPHSGWKPADRVEKFWY
ncbi:serine hydrolase [Ginsengibacter hankyongi]|uniref:Serine hydrolase n=1 Tax=Ginsengibacter hankyongi TaxID=2607284 RepID=A0A5J5IF05_9BACT|nr:serine hydrolase [Ginsengibacter hankyongi]KAA9038598.1 serine hydrolase [Ginsengibacter hankyongi]